MVAYIFWVVGVNLIVMKIYNYLVLLTFLTIAGCNRTNYLSVSEAENNRIYEVVESTIFRMAGTEENSEGKKKYRFGVSYINDTLMQITYFVSLTDHLDCLCNSNNVASDIKQFSFSFDLKGEEIKIQSLATLVEQVQNIEKSLDTNQSCKNQKKLLIDYFSNPRKLEIRLLRELQDIILFSHNSYVSTSLPLDVFGLTTESYSDVDGDEYYQISDTSMVLRNLSNDFGIWKTSEENAQYRIDILNIADSQNKSNIPYPKLAHMFINDELELDSVSSTIKEINKIVVDKKTKWATEWYSKNTADNGFIYHIMEKRIIEIKK